MESGVLERTDQGPGSVADEAKALMHDGASENGHDGPYAGLPWIPMPAKSTKKIILKILTMTNYVNLALEFKDVTKIRALPPDRDESKIIKYYMRFVINNICNDGKNLTHTMYIPTMYNK